MKSLGFILFLTSTGLCAQSFHRAAIVLQTGGGIDAYKTQQVYTPVGGSRDTTVSSNAASANFYGGLEFGLGKHIGIGARGRLNSFFRDIDEVIRERTAVNTADMLFALNLHPIVTRKLDLVLGAEAGVSNLDLTFTDLPRNMSTARGRYGAIYIEPRIYWKRLGFHVRASLPFARYSSINTVAENLSAQKFTISGWSGRGFGFSAGLQLRIF